MAAYPASGIGRVVFLFLMTWLAAGADVSAAGVSADGLTGKVIAGYQGWFDCPGDAPLNPSGWGHWFRGPPDADHVHFDLLPATGEYDRAGLCATSMRRRSDGRPIMLYTPLDPDVVRTHFRWMAEAGIDGAAVQRFISRLDSAPARNRDDRMLRNVQAAAEATGRVFYVVYDVSGADPDRVFDRIRSDWRHLANDLHVTASPRYLRRQGRPLLEIWGFGFAGRKYPSDTAGARRLLDDLKSGRTGPAASLIGGVPAHWRTHDGDASDDASWDTVYRDFDVLSAWTVGRYSDDAGADAFLRDRVLPDMQAAKRWGIGYMPVIFPGFSAHNAYLRSDFDGRLLPLIAPWRHPLDQIPRRCGTFYWQQIRNLVTAHATMLYVAMFDELDEGTAIFKIVRRPDGLPRGANLLALDDDCKVPDDWYLRLTGRAGFYLRTHNPVPASVWVAGKP